MKPKLLVFELWGIGDLAIATPFLAAAGDRYEVHLVAKPVALEMQDRFWPGVKVIPFTAPWTAFRGKYWLCNWPWLQMAQLRRLLRTERFDLGLSARWDPRDHILLRLSGAPERFGFPRLGSHRLLTQLLNRPGAQAHRYEHWQISAESIGVNLPLRAELRFQRRSSGKQILAHSGAGQPVRVWPLERFRSMVGQLRNGGYTVQVACDSCQEQWWLNHGEETVKAPNTIAKLLDLLDNSKVFIGNDSGPGHLAAICGLPTLTIFGPQMPEWFAPIHSDSEWIDGKACRFKPCFDYCRYAAPYCMTDISAAEVWTRVEQVVRKHCS